MLPIEQHLQGMRHSHHKYVGGISQVKLYFLPRWANHRKENESELGGHMIEDRNVKEYSPGIRDRWI